MKAHFHHHKKIILIFLVTFPGLISADVPFDSKWLSGIRARSIGPAGMSGRVGAVEALASDPDTIYIGAATGGIWKTTNGGTTWSPIFDGQPVASIGALAVFQADPNIVWCGTGEGNPRNSAGVGNGIYKSLDAGKSWTHLGLEKSERISRIILHPSDPETAFVAALGPAWNDGSERGVFKTSDGGKTWQKALYVDQRTGAADLAVDPRNPNRLFAAMWEYRRWPWFFKSGGPGSGLYLTSDGGLHWKKLNTGSFPVKGELGRIGVAISLSKPETIYALVEATESALIRSDDGGETWAIINNSPGIAPRPFYYADIRVDPKNENRLYNLHIMLDVSEDGGKTFSPLVDPGRVHPDHHALWIHPENSRFLIDGNDGGISISRDQGKNWRFVSNLPIAQFYHIAVDGGIPYNVYGGMQDNSSWWGPSAVWEAGGIRNHHWANIGFGDGFHAVPNPRYVGRAFTMWQGGFLLSADLTTGELKDIKPAPRGSERLRFNWNAGFAVDPFDPGKLYLGSQFIHMSPDQGRTWTVISPDLTTDDPEKQRQRESGGLSQDVNLAESAHTTITAISPSPVEKGLIWAGTDDGNVQLTRDAGRTWKNLTKGIPDFPEGATISHIEASRFRGNTAFLTADDHGRGNWKTYLYKTSDYGETWADLGTSQISGFAHVIKQDPVEERLLFLGTEFGLFFSLDEGRNWFKWTEGFPAAPVRSLAVHPRDHDLVIGTHGRSIYVIDDIQPLRALGQDVFSSPCHLFDLPPAQQYRVKRARGEFSPGHAFFEGENRPYGALFTFWIQPESGVLQAVAEISAADGEVLRKLEIPVKPGLNRAVWDLRREKFRLPNSPEAEVFMSLGPEVPPGEYALRLSAGPAEAKRIFQVKADPRIKISLEERLQKYRMILRTGRRIEKITEVLERIRSAVPSLDLVLEKSKSLPSVKAKRLAQAGEQTRRRMLALESRLVSPQGRRVYGDEKILEKFDFIHFSLDSSWDAPTEAQVKSLNRAEEELKGILKEWNYFLEADYSSLRKKARASKITVLPDIKSLIIEELLSPLP